MISFEWLGSGVGHLVSDNLLGFLAVVAALFYYYRIATSSAHPGIYVARWLIALGWTLLAGRILSAWASGQDVQIAPVSLIALALLASGSILRGMYDR